MVVQTNEQNNLEFRAVYLSDLKSIINLYRESESDEILAGSKQQLTEHFGLPLNLVAQHSKIIAYSFINIDGMEEASVQFRIHKEFEQSDIGKKLSQFTAAAHVNSFGLVDGLAFSDRAGIQKSVKRLVDWLNRCDLAS